MALAMGFLTAGPAIPLRAEVLEQRVIYDQDPWDPQNRLEVGDCQRGSDGSITCDTRPQGQVWVETVEHGRN
jgi:hypothetical protein